VAERTSDRRWSVSGFHLFFFKNVIAHGGASRQWPYIMFLNGNMSNAGFEKVRGKYGATSL
jgi:hypothetical protein